MKLIAVTTALAALALLTPVHAEDAAPPNDADAMPITEMRIDDYHRL